MLAAFMQRPLKLVRLPRARLEREGLLPECSPFSGLWMSSLDNTRSKRELSMEYTSMEAYVEKLVKFFQSSPQRTIAGYARRNAELALGSSAG
jgi:hypothetical protein